MKYLYVMLMLCAGTVCASSEESAAKAIANHATYLIRSMDSLGEPMLLLSLKLDPECEQALLVKGLLIRKMRPDKVDPISVTKLISGLTKRGEQLLNSKSVNSQQLGCLYIVGGLKLDPENKKLIMLHTKAIGRGLVVDFDKLVGGMIMVAPEVKVIVKMKIPYNAKTYNNHHYKFIEDKPKTWTEADEYCKSVGGYLLTITTKEENIFISSIIDKKGRGWMGAVNDNGWKWSNGEKWSYTNFYHRSRGKYSYFRGIHGNWGLMPTIFLDGNNRISFICEWDK